MMRSVQRVLAVFESFTPEKSSLSLHELSERIELPKSTAFRFVQSLEKAGYLVRLDDQTYCLSFRFIRFSGLVKSTLGIREIARPILTELAERTRETATLHTRSGVQRVCIDVVATASPLRSVSQPGEQARLGAGGASSKVLAAFLSQKEAAPIVAEMALSSQRTQVAVREELAEVRKRGFAVSHGERVLGVWAVAAPILGVDDAVNYCVAVAGPTVRMQVHEKDFVKLVKQAATDVSLQYGGTVDAQAWSSMSR
jgi:DNA-binding IclR family transcriptional regulator